MHTLVVLEVSQKQNYIFRTNRLKENIGASMIIREVTEDLPDQVIADRGIGEQGSCVFKGGGKSVYEFVTRESAQIFARAISYRVREQYPGAELFLASLDYDPERDLLIDAIERLYSALEVKKSARTHSFGLRGLGIAQRCVDSQAPAVTRDEEGRLISAECLAKIRKAAEHDAFFREIIPNPAWRFADAFDELGGTRGVKDMIAVIVIDGNKMGAKIKQFRTNYKAQTAGIQDIGERNRRYCAGYAALSQSLDNAYRKAVQDAAVSLMERLQELREQRIVSPAHDEVSGKDILPMRPLILSGDDVCIVSDARIGVSLAAQILRNIDKVTIDTLGTPMPLHACAGIAMVRTSYPFYRAHELAEELCSNAKSILPVNDSADESVIDFAIVQGEIAGSLSDIRRKQYHDGLLTAKPYYIEENGRQNSLPYYERRMETLRTNVSRGKVKEYRTALARGESSANDYATRMRMGIGRDISYITIAGEHDRHCLDYDVIEMWDVYNRLEGGRIG